MTIYPSELLEPEETQPSPDLPEHLALGRILPFSAQTTPPTRPFRLRSYIENPYGPTTRPLYGRYSG